LNFSQSIIDLSFGEGDTMIFDPQDEIEIKKRLSEMTHEVKMILFTQTLNCETCSETESLLKAVTDLTDQIRLEVLNPQIDRERAVQYNINRVPAIIIEGDKDYGMRYFGIPGGYEFASLLEDLVAVGKRESGLGEATKAWIQNLTEPLNLKVFVTPG
jgi:glutaredoxin-like protein